MTIWDYADLHPWLSLLWVLLVGCVVVPFWIDRASSWFIWNRVKNRQEDVKSRQEGNP